MNSPGGGVVESADIYDAITCNPRREGKFRYMFQWAEWLLQVVIMCQRQQIKIFVNRETITGSIGVIMESVNYCETR